MCLPHGLRDMCIISLGLSALNEYGSGVIDILIGSVHHIGWCIVRRQAIWQEGMLVLNLHKLGAAHTPQIVASLTYHIRGLMIYLVEARCGSRVHLSNDAGSGNCNRIDLHYLRHAHHVLHIVAIFSFMASMSAFIRSCTSSISPITLALAHVR